MRKIISGGQTGADLGALKAARKTGLRHGGWAPKGFKTEHGKSLWLQSVYGLRETISAKYEVRTIANIRHSDGTLIIAANFDSPGTRLTWNAVRQAKKPVACVSMLDPWNPKRIAKWIWDKQIAVLNVAGNRESVAPGIEDFTQEYLTQVLHLFAELLLHGSGRRR